MEGEKQRLLAEITQSMSDAITKLETLNRNLDHVVQVGNDFQSISTIWNEFSTKLALPIGEEFTKKGLSVN